LSSSSSSSSSLSSADNQIRLVIKIIRILKTLAKFVPLIVVVSTALSFISAAINFIGGNVIAGVILSILGLFGISLLWRIYYYQTRKEG
jgi:hypothetical protein